MIKAIAKTAGNVLQTNKGKGAALFGAGALAGSALSDSNGGGNNSSGDNNNNKDSSGMFSSSNIILIVIACIIFYRIGHKFGLF